MKIRTSGNTQLLTDTLLRNAKPKDRPYKLPREAGLCLIVNPNGSKWWRFTYSFGGKEKTISLGTYPLIPLTLARQRRDAARRLVAEGADPSAQRKAERQAQTTNAANTFAAMTALWEADEMASNSDEYRATVRRMLERDVLPYLGERPVVEITTRELVAVLDHIRQRGVEETARRARTSVGQVFRYAIRRGFAEHDPTLALKGERRVKPVKHFAAFTDPADVARLMRSIYDYKGTHEVRAALKLSAMLFQRPGEIRQMQWPQLDLDSAQWRYVVNKTKRHTGASHIVPLPAQAVQILRELHPLTGQGLDLKPDAPRYVFPTPRTRLRPLSENAVRQALRNMGFTNDDMTAHGFRAMARTLLAEQGWKPDAIERQLSHKASGPLGAAYDRAAFLNERKAMMQSWADYLDTLRCQPNGGMPNQVSCQRAAQVHHSIEVLPLAEQSAENLRALLIHRAGESLGGAESELGNSDRGPVVAIGLAERSDTDVDKEAFWHEFHSHRRRVSGLCHRAARHYVSSISRARFSSCAFSLIIFCTTIGRFVYLSGCNSLIFLRQASWIKSREAPAGTCECDFGRNRYARAEARN